MSETMLLLKKRFRERLCCWPIVSRSATLPTVAMAAAVPTFSWTYKAGQQQQQKQPHPICPQGQSHNCFQGHLDTGLAPQRFMDFQLKAFECQLFKVRERDRELWQCFGLLYLPPWAYRPSFISALLSQMHVDVQQGQRSRGLTLIHWDKNENTSLWKCHFSFAALLKVLQRNMMSHFLLRAALWEWETVCDIVSRHIDPHCGVRKTYCTSAKMCRRRFNSEHLNKNLFPPLDWPNRFLERVAAQYDKWLIDIQSEQ